MTVALVVLVLIAVIAVGVAMTGGEEADLVEHAEWMRQVKEDGAWVMW